MRKAAFAQTSQAFAFAGRRISICRAATTPEQEKALHDALDRRAGQRATLKRSRTHRIMRPQPVVLRAEARSMRKRGTAGVVIDSTSPAALFVEMQRPVV